MAEKKASERLADVEKKLGPLGATLFRASALNRRELDAEEGEVQKKLEHRQSETALAELSALEKRAPLTGRLRRLLLAKEFAAADIFREANGFGLRQEAELLKDGEPSDPPSAA